MSDYLHTARKALTHKDSLLALLNSEFGSVASNYVLKIDTILLSGISLSAKIDAIEVVEDSAPFHLTGYHLVFVQAIAAISRYSLSYWSSDDTTKWIGWKWHQRAIVNRASPKERTRIILAEVTDPFWADWMGAILGAIEWDGLWAVPIGGEIGGILYSLGCGLMASALAAQ